VREHEAQDWFEGAAHDKCRQAVVFWLLVLLVDLGVVCFVGFSLGVSQGFEEGDLEGFVVLGV